MKTSLYQIEFVLFFDHRFKIYKWIIYRVKFKTKNHNNHLLNKKFAKVKSTLKTIKSFKGEVICRDIAKPY